MDDQPQDGMTSHHHQHNSGGDHPVRSRWTPKPEQILILETIFNSGMVNPPKDETVRIRKLLEKFGPVGDVNVFYWFQNRRSRSRRRQRQIQATQGGGGAAEPQQAPPPSGGTTGGEVPCYNFVPGGTGFVPSTTLSFTGPLIAGSTSSTSCGLDGNGNNAHYSGNLISFSGQVNEFEQNHSFSSADSTNYPYQSEVITVFINGVATEVGRGALDIKGMFGGDLMIFHSSGIPVQLNEYGILVQGLQQGESYFLVPRIS